MVSSAQRRPIVVSPSYLFVASFWRGLAERAILAATWAFLAVLGVPNVADGTGFDVRHIGWLDAISIAAGAAILSALKSVVVGGSGIGPTGSPSLVDDRPTPQDMAAGQQLVRDEQAGRHRDDGLDVATDNAAHADDDIDVALEGPTAEFPLTPEVRR
jgi:Putative lactococcus lactis phage r1t holin